MSTALPGEHSLPSPLSVNLHLRHDLGQFLLTKANAERYVVTIASNMISLLLFAFKFNLGVVAGWAATFVKNTPRGWVGYARVVHMAVVGHEESRFKMYMGI